jgi:uncharacterized protein YcbK (DUF882 family)
MEIHRILRSLLLLAGVFALTAAGALFLSVRSAVQESRPTVALALKKATELEDSLRGSSEGLHKMAQAYGKQADAQAKYATAITQKGTVLLDNANGAVSDLRTTEAQLSETLKQTNLQLNGALLPNLAATARESENAMYALTTDLDRLRATIDDADAQVSSPDIPATLKNLRETSANVASMTAHTDATAGDIQAAVHRWTKPPHGIWNVIKGLLTPAAHAAELYHFL